MLLSVHVYQSLRHASYSKDGNQRDVAQQITATLMARTRTVAETALFWSAFPTAPARHVHAFHLRQRQDMADLMLIAEKIPDCPAKKKLVAAMNEKAHPVGLQPLRKVRQSISNELRKDIKRRLRRVLTVTSYQDDSISIKKNVYRSLGFSWNEPGIGFVIMALMLFDVTNNKTGAKSAETFKRCLTEFGISFTEKLADSVTDGGSNMCDVTGPNTSMNAVLLNEHTLLSSTWCTPHQLSLGLGDVLTSNLCKEFLQMNSDIQSLFTGTGSEGPARELRKACEDVLDQCAEVGRKRALINFTFLSP